jgi:G:T-mismatch repair DNA endonuclease (very short patch repair protein)
MLKKDKLIQDKYNGIYPTCQCGCGQQTRYEAKLKDFCKWISGHQSRVPGHFGDPKAKKRVDAIIKTRKAKFMSGEYNHILEHVSQKRSKKIIDKISNTKKQQWETGKIGKKKYKPSKLEKTFTNILDLLEINYETSYYIKDIKAFYDVYLPEYNILIEVDGDFWHSNPLKYPNGPINKCQIQNVARDKIKSQWALDNGYKLLRFWENDINNNILRVKQILLENLVK